MRTNGAPPPLQQFTLTSRTISLVEIVEVLDQLSFLDWAVGSSRNHGVDFVEVEITFNQFCQPLEQTDAGIDESAVGK